MQNYKKKFLYFFKSVDLIPNTPTPLQFFEYRTPYLKNWIFNQKKHPYSPQELLWWSFLSAYSTISNNKNSSVLTRERHTLFHVIHYPH